MQILDANILNIPTIQQIAKITWADTYTFLSDAQMSYMLNWMYSTTSLQQQMQNEHKFYLAKKETEIIGFASVNKETETICKLNKLYVLPQTQKTGAGKLLLKEVINFTKNNNCNLLQLQVNRNNTAKDFYLKNGFRILFEKDFEIGDGFYMNDYVMELSF